MIEKTPDQLYEELQCLRDTAEVIADRLGDIASAIQFLTNNLFDPTCHPDIAASIREFGILLQHMASLPTEQQSQQALDQAVEVAGDLVAVTAQSLANQQLEQAASEAGELVAINQQVLFGDRGSQPSPGATATGAEVEPSQPANHGFVRPDRQTHFNGTPGHEWPEPSSDANTITVDRYQATGSPIANHRFTIHRGDRVSVSINGNHYPGQVVGISQARDEVKVKYDGADEASWHLVGTIYPEPELAPAGPVEAVTSAQLSGASNTQNAVDGGVSAADQVSLPLSKAIYEPFGFIDRVAYAKHCLLEGDTGHPDFDACFKSHDGEFVVVRLLQLAETDAHLRECLEEREWTDIQDTDSEEFMELSLEELAAKARLSVQSRLSGSGDSSPAVLNTESQSATTKQPREQPSAAEPYTIEDWKSLQTKLDNGALTAELLKSEFQRMTASGEPIIALLVKSHNAQELKNWATRWTGRAESTKRANAEKIFRGMLQSFALGQTISYRPFDGETFEEAVAKAVAGITDKAIAAVVAQRKQQQADTHKAVTDPETFEEWRLYVRTVRPYSELEPDQKVVYERVCADYTRQQRAKTQQKTVSRIVIDEDLSFSIKEGWHDKKEKPLWIVQLSNRVERETFKQLKAQAKEFGGWFSDFKAADAGFQFYDQTAAESFSKLLDADVDNTAAQQAAKIRKMDNASQRFQAVADNLERDCTAVLEADPQKLKNTSRRAEMAAGMRADAHHGLALVNTLRGLAGQLESGEIQYLDGINAATQLQTITKLLRAAKYERVRQEIRRIQKEPHGSLSSQTYETMTQQPLDAADVAYANYPHPYVYRGQIVLAMEKLGQTKGMIRSTHKLMRIIKQANPESDCIEFKNEHSVATLADFLGRAKAAGYENYWFENCLVDFKRMQAANIHNTFELRTAMRELLPYLAQTEGDDPVVKAEDELRGKQLPGFFPTPQAVIYQMLELADIQPTDKVLEPSAGKGDILAAIRQAHPEVELAGIEYNLSLRQLLAARGYDELVEFGDFLEHQGSYDKIVMNPPFEKGADIEHVQHAYDLLDSGGRVVSVMCEGPFFRSDAKSQAFRDWLERLDAHVEELPNDAFQGVEAFRATGVKTRLVAIEKP